MKFAFTLLASAIAFGVTVGSAHAADDIITPVIDASGSGQTRAEVVADLKAYRESGLADLNRVDADRGFDQDSRRQAEERYQQLRGAAGLVAQAPAVQLPSPRSRTDVLAELKAYRTSGLADLDHADADLSMDQRARAQAEQRYQQLLAAERTHSVASK